MNRKDIVLGLTIAVLLAILISPFASSWPDGLERVAEDKGFIEKSEVKPSLSSPIPGYVWPGVKNEKLAASFAGLAGTLIVFGMGYGVGSLLKRKKA